MMVDVGKEDEDFYRVPSLLEKSCAEEIALYKEVESFIICKSDDKNGGKVEIPWQILDSLAKSVGLSYRYSVAIKKFISLGLIERSGYFNQEGSGRARKYWLCERISNNYIEETLPAKYPKLNHRSIRLNAAYEGWSQDFYRKTVKPVCEIGLKKYRFTDEVFQAIKNSDKSVLSKQHWLMAVASRSRWLAGIANRRVYSSWTGLPKQLRQYARIAGKPLVGLDFHALHPCLLAYQAADQDFLGLYADNDIYLLLMNEAEAKAYGFSRSRIKEAFLALINAKNDGSRFTDKNGNNVDLRPIRAISERLFPRLMDWCNQVKAKDHTEMSPYLESLEWKTMFPLAKSLHYKLAKPNGAAILPLHDAIWVPSDLADRARSIMQEEAPSYLRLG